MKTRVRLSALPALAALLLAPVGCSTQVLRGGFPEGFEEEIKTAVQLKAAPADATTLLTSVDSEITRRLGQDKDMILDAAIADYEKQRAENGTVIKRPENAKVVIQDFTTDGEDASHTRQKYQGEVTKFHFTLHDVKARIMTEPSRIEVMLFNKERSWAPEDTGRFSQMFRAEVRNYVTKAIYDVAKGLNTDPVMPRLEDVE